MPRDLLKPIKKESTVEFAVTGEKAHSDVALEALMVQCCVNANGNRHVNDSLYGSVKTLQSFKSSIKKVDFSSFVKGNGVLIL